MIRIPYLDSHTGGEPTRLIEEGYLNLGGGSVAEQREIFNKRFDSFRSAVLNEPRGSDVMVGAMLVKPKDKTCQLGVIFFNNVGMLGMCGHGTIGVVSSLSYLGKIKPGKFRIETPVGIVQAELHPEEKGEYPNLVSVINIPSYRAHKNVSLEVDGILLHGDVAWGGNWFFLSKDHGQNVDSKHLDQLTEFSWKIRNALTIKGVTGDNGEEIDHIELFDSSNEADSKSFVLCPGKAYDRSPCGTGTSAKLACLFADGHLEPGVIWKQQSVIGSIFEGSVQIDDGNVIPTISGRAWVMAQGNLLFDERDPFKDGIRLMEPHVE